MSTKKNTLKSRGQVKGLEIEEWSYLRIHEINRALVVVEKI